MVLKLLLKTSLLLSPLDCNHRPPLPLQRIHNLAHLLRPDPRRLQPPRHGVDVAIHDQEVAHELLGRADACVYEVGVRDRADAGDVVEGGVLERRGEKGGLLLGGGGGVKGWARGVCCHWW